MLTTAQPAERSEAWDGFSPGPWTSAIDVRDFIQRNYTPTPATAPSWPARPRGPTRCGAAWRRMFAEERARGIYDVDPHTPSTITAHAPGLHRPRPTS